MKNELMQVWYWAVFMVTQGGKRREYSIYVQGSSEVGAAVRAAVGICETDNGLLNPTFKSIRMATYGEAEQLDAELDAAAGEDTKELEEEGDE